MDYADIKIHGFDHSWPGGSMKCVLHVYTILLFKSMVYSAFE